jgi:hypothetical protein
VGQKTLTTRAVALLVAFGVTSLILVGHSRQSNQGEVYVSVSDAKGKPGLGLTARDFVVRLDDQQVEVVEARAAVEPLALVFVIDTGFDDLPNVRASLRSAFASIGQNSPGARVAVTYRLQPALNLVDVSDGHAVDRMLAQLVQGSYGLLPDVLSATDALAKETTTRRAIVGMIRIFPGMQSTTDNVTSAQTAKALRRTGTSLWAIDIGSTGRSGDTDELERVLVDVTRSSGGNRYALNTVLSVETVLSRILTLLEHQYLVTYRTSAVQAGSQQLRVGVRRPGVQVLAPVWSRDKTM